MTDPELKNSHAQADFEQQDLGFRPILMFLIWLGVILAVLALALKGGYVLMDRYTAAQQPEVSPLKAPVNPDTRQVSKGDVKQFPEPRLEEDERTELKDFRLKEEEQLGSYGWVDQKAGTLHIPIDRAMQLVVERGLPVRNEAAAPNKVKR